MSKRRNLKKEKAQRNKAYARKFRKSTGRFSNRGRYGGSNRSEDDSNKNKDKDESNQQRESSSSVGDKN